MPTNLNTGLMGKQFDTGIPGFDILSQAASTNVKDLLQGVESPAITQNMNAYWGVGAGVPGSEFLRNRAVDLYGQRAQARKEQGLTDLLNMMQGYSGTVTAKPSDIIGAETAMQQIGSQERLAEAQRALQAQQLAEQQRQFNLGYGLDVGRLGNQYLNTYMGWLQ